MSDLAPITALGADAPRRVVHGRLTIEEVPDVGLASLAIRSGGATPKPGGLDLPQAGRWAHAIQGDRELGAFWMGPGQWMIEAPGAAETDFAGDLSALAPGCSVTEQTDGWSVLEVSSPEGAGPLLRLMEKLVNLPPAATGPGCASRTLVHHMGVFVIRRSEDRLAFVGMRSAAQPLWHAVEDAAQRLAAPVP